MRSIYDKNQMQRSDGNLKPYNDPSKSIRKVKRSPLKTSGDLSARGNGTEKTQKQLMEEEIEYVKRMTGRL